MKLSVPVLDLIAQQHSLVTTVATVVPAHHSDQLGTPLGILQTDIPGAAGEVLSAPDEPSCVLFLLVIYVLYIQTPGGWKEYGELPSVLPMWSSKRIVRSIQLPCISLTSTRNRVTPFSCLMRQFLAVWWKEPILQDYLFSSSNR